MVALRKESLAVWLLAAILIVPILMLSALILATRDEGGTATSTPTLTPAAATTPIPATTALYYSPCWGILDWGDEPYHQGGAGFVACWTGYGIGFWNACWDNPNGCWDGSDVSCRDDGGEGWKTCYDYFVNNGEGWESSAVVPGVIGFPELETYGKEK